jgi:hypothetical protein
LRTKKREEGVLKMASDKLQIHRQVKLKDGQLLMGFSGWMDGGNISTGTVKFLVEQLDAQKLADIEPEGFYIYNFPGSMEVSAMFRPHTRIRDGLVELCDMPRNTFFLVPAVRCEDNIFYRQRCRPGAAYTSAEVLVLGF